MFIIHSIRKEIVFGFNYLNKLQNFIHFLHIIFIDLETTLFQYDIPFL